MARVLRRTICSRICGTFFFGAFLHLPEDLGLGPMFGWWFQSSNHFQKNPLYIYIYIFKFRDLYIYIYIWHDDRTCFYFLKQVVETCWTSNQKFTLWVPSTSAAHGVSQDEVLSSGWRRSDADGNLMVLGWFNTRIFFIANLNCQRLWYVMIFHFNSWFKDTKTLNFWFQKKST